MKFFGCCSFVCIESQCMVASLNGNCLVGQYLLYHVTEKALQIFPVEKKGIALFYEQHEFETKQKLRNFKKHEQTEFQVLT